MPNQKNAIKTLLFRGTTGTSNDQPPNEPKNEPKGQGLTSPFYRIMEEVIKDQRCKLIYIGDLGDNKVIKL